MTWLNSIGQRSRSQQAVEVAKASISAVVEVHFLIITCSCWCSIHTGNEQSSETGRHLVVPAVPHHFSIMIDLRRIANLTVSHPVLIFVRWVFSCIVALCHHIYACFVFLSPFEYDTAIVEEVTFFLSWDGVQTKDEIEWTSSLVGVIGSTRNHMNVLHQLPPGSWRPSGSPGLSSYCYQINVYVCVCLSQYVWFHMLFISQLYVHVFRRYRASCQPAASGSASWNWSSHSTVMLYISICHNSTTPSGNVPQVCIMVFISHCTLVVFSDCLGQCTFCDTSFKLYVKYKLKIVTTCGVWWKPWVLEMFRLARSCLFQWAVCCAQYRRHFVFV